MSITIQRKTRLKEVIFTFCRDDYHTGIETFAILRRENIRGISSSNIVPKKSFSIVATLAHLELINAKINYIQEEQETRLLRLKII